MVELPFGNNKRWLHGASWKSRAFGDWQWTGNLSILSGSPFTPRVLGSFLDVSRGTGGTTLRANVTGQSVHLDHPTIAEWFNTAAFVAPPAGQFGDAGRNSLEGPGGVLFDMSVAKDVRLKDTRGVEFRATATNVFNIPRYTSIQAAINSPTYGQVIGVGSMRKMQLSARYRF